MTTPEQFDSEESFNDWQLPEEEMDTTARFDIEGEYGPSEFLRIIRNAISLAIADGSSPSYLNVLEEWEKRVLDLTGGYEGDPNDYLIGFNQAEDGFTYLLISIRGSALS